MPVLWHCSIRILVSEVNEHATSESLQLAKVNEE